MQPARALTHWDDEDDIRLDLEDDEPWWRDYAWLPLMGAYLLVIVFWMPAARLACWAVLWACYLGGSEPAPPAPYTLWAP